MDGHGGQEAAIYGMNHLGDKLREAHVGRKAKDGPGITKLQRCFEEVDKACIDELKKVFPHTLVMFIL